ncbi:MAG TPA: class I SAM-dependent rRNA methyltransferase [Gemmataceae bacterium]
MQIRTGESEKGRDRHPDSPPPAVFLRPRRARPFFHRHPWVFPGAIERVDGEPEDGAEVDVRSHAGTFVARGIYNGRSKIRVRLYHWEPDRPLDRDFFMDRLRRALALRRDVLGLVGPPQTGGEGGSTAYRLVASEADGLSGCTIDVYGEWVVAQFTALGMAQRRGLLAECLTELLRPRGIYLRTERGVGQLEGLELRDGPLAGEAPPETFEILEDGLRFRVNIREGQKTGFYLDQRDNRREVAKLAAGRRVLDGFCYTGGFGLHAARAGAAEVVGVDGSEAAVELARANAAANGLGNARFERADVFDFLGQQVRAGERYGLVVLDPPKFARGRAAVPEALRGYRRLQTLALRLLGPGGVLVMCCCSGLITAAMLEELLAQVAVAEARELQLLQRRGAAPDHPVSLACPESEYLKCLILRAV